MATDTLLQLRSALKDLNKDDANFTLLLGAHDMVANSLIDLAKTAAITPDVNSDKSYELGSIVYAPRFVKGVILTDIAIVISKDCCDEGNLEYIDVVFLRPQNAYEAVSSGSRYPASQIKPNAISLYNKQMKDLDNVRVGADVLVKPPGLEYWTNASVVWFDDAAKQVTVKIMPDNFTVTIPCDISSICPTLAHPSAHPKHAAHFTVDDDEAYSGSAHYIDTSSLPANRSSSSSSLVSFDSLIGLGDWERHTKGIGSKLMHRMGYKRCVI